MTASAQQTAESIASEWAALTFVIQQVLNRVATSTLVQVKGVTNAGELSPVGFVDVQPLVNLLTGNGESHPHGIVYNVPYMRLQGGTNAIILDPQVGDIGICQFASRDISAVKTAKGPANPGSKRQFDYADGLYIGGVLNGVPEQYIQFADGGITVLSPTKITLQAPQIDIKGPVTQTDGDVSLAQNLSVGDTATAATDVIGGGKSLKTHTHSGVTPGGGNTGPPT